MNIPKIFELPPLQLREVRWKFVCEALVAFAKKRWVSTGVSNCARNFP